MQQQNEQRGDIYKDVVIIGNGPSGMSLSYLLAGNWPRYTGAAHPGDEMLTARLRHSVATQTEHPGCLVCASKRSGLEELAAGLEGRNSGKPLSLLLDQLQHPCLDAGLDVPPLLHWTPPRADRRHKPIDHVVLGKGPPGGAWHILDPNVLTISLSRWMSLPGLDLRDWQAGLDSKEREQKLAGRGEATEIDVNYNSARVPIGTIAAYYKDYVVKQGLEKYFRCGMKVTSVRPIQGVPNSENEYGWLVEGHELESGQRWRYRCKRVVLATGTTDSYNRLGVPGEDTYSWVTHDFKDFERKLDRCNSPLSTSLQISDEYESQELKPGMEPVLIVGSGLSAADAIMSARSRGVSVLHVFRASASKPERKRSLDRLQWLPASMYPEYHRVYEMMADRSRSYSLYRALPDHGVVDFTAGSDKYARAKTRNVTLCNSQARLITYRVSFAAVLIGSKPDLSYLPNNGIGLGKNPDKPIDSRLNQINVDAFTYEVERAPRKGLYAIGPLAGDNFVRFILGGAFGVLANVVNGHE